MRLASFVVAAGSALAMTVAAAPARAATVTVNTTTPDSSSDNKCGLVEAVQAINQASTYRSCTYTANGQSDKIVFSVSGTHAVATSLTPTRNVEITGLGQSSTIVTSTGNCTFCSFGSSSGATHVVGLRSMTIQKNASASGNTFGVMVLPSSAVRLYTDSVRVTGFGIGIYAYASNATLQINGSTIDSNQTGIYLGGGFLQLTSSTVRNNTLGGIQIYQWDSPAHYSYISNSTIRDNAATDGAGIRVFAEDNVDDSSSPVLDITGSTISGNNATGNGGGLFANAAVRVASTVFDNNSAGNLGGGFVAYERGGGYPVEINTSVFKNNRAAKGAGFSNYGPSDGQRVKVQLYQSTFGPSNVATSDGGGIYSFSQIDVAENLTIHGNQAARGGGLFHDSGGESHLFHCTVTGNRATQSNGGGGMWLRTGNPVYRFNIIAENRAGTGSTPPLNNVVTTNPSLNAGYNLLDDVTGVSALFPTSSSGGTNLVGNAQLGPFGYNGGFGDTRPLLASSPALDYIPPDQDGTELDQRGIIRPVDGNFNGTASPDIGALEMNSSSTMYEGESQTVAAQSGETLTTESNGSYSAGIGRVKQANLNGYVTLQTPTIQPGTYGVIVWFKKASNAGRFRLAVGTSASSTTNLGGETDGYRSAAQWTKVNLGTITVSSAGARYFKLTATSKNGSSSGYWMFIDAIQLYKTN